MIIELLNGKKFDILNHNLGLEDYDIPSIEISNTLEYIDGAPGPTITSTTYLGRMITAYLVYKARDYDDYILLRNELNNIFTRKESFYVIFKDEPWKRWLVKADGQFLTAKELEVVGSFPLNFICVRSFAESIADTTTLKEWDIDKWAWDGSITWDGDLEYIFSANVFTVKNLGNEVVDPRNWPLEIVLKGTFASNVVLRNRTTGDEVVFVAPITANDTLSLINARTLKNGVSALKSNRGKTLITLAPGDNIIEISGGTVSSVAFNFRFPYK